MSCATNANITPDVLIPANPGEAKSDSEERHAAVSMDATHVSIKTVLPPSDTNYLFPLTFTMINLQSMIKSPLNTEKTPHWHWYNANRNKGH